MQKGLLFYLTIGVRAFYHRHPHPLRPESRRVPSRYALANLFLSCIALNSLSRSWTPPSVAVTAFSPSLAATVVLVGLVRYLTAQPTGSGRNGCARTALKDGICLARWTISAAAFRPRFRYEAMVPCLSTERQPWSDGERCAAWLSRITALWASMWANRSMGSESRGRDPGEVPSTRRRVSTAWTRCFRCDQKGGLVSTEFVIGLGEAGERWRARQWPWRVTARMHSAKLDRGGIFCGADMASGRKAVRMD